MGKHKPSKSEIRWIIWADRFYITARFLYWNNMIYVCMFLGAHAIELYLKAFLINKCGYYISGHDLVLLYEECRKLDTFFEDNNIAKHFMGHAIATQGTSAQWSDYLEIIKYPEALPARKNERPKSFSFSSGGFMKGSTIESLDLIASFIHKTINIPKVGGRSAIRDLIQGNGWIYGIQGLSPFSQLENQPDLLNCLFKQNPSLQEIYRYQP